MPGARKTAPGGKPGAANEPMRSAEAPRLLGDFIPWREVQKVAPHVFTSPGRVRHLLRNRERNGLAPHLVWVGREPFVTADGLRAWLASLTEKPPRGSR